MERKLQNRAIQAFFLLMTILVASSLPGCGSGQTGSFYPPDQSWRVTISRGVWGQVWLWKGDFMPGPNAPSGKITPVQRIVEVYPLTNLTDVVVAPQNQGGPFFQSVKTQRIASVQSDEKGFFQVELPPGKYSLLVRENGLLYSVWYDGVGNLCPIEVLEGKVTKAQLDLMYNATF
jgi:hypothetical protein